MLKQYCAVCALPLDWEEYLPLQRAFSGVDTSFVPASGVVARIVADSATLRSGGAATAPGDFISQNLGCSHLVHERCSKTHTQTQTHTDCLICTVFNGDTAAHHAACKALSDAARKELSDAACKELSDKVASSKSHALSQTYRDATRTRAGVDPKQLAADDEKKASAIVAIRNEIIARANDLRNAGIPSASSSASFIRAASTVRSSDLNPLIARISGQLIHDISKELARDTRGLLGRMLCQSSTAIPKFFHNIQRDQSQQSNGHSLTESQALVSQTFGGGYGTSGDDILQAPLLVAHQIANNTLAERDSGASMHISIAEWNSVFSTVRTQLSQHFLRNKPTVLSGILKNVTLQQLNYPTASAIAENVSREHTPVIAQIIRSELSKGFFQRYGIWMMVLLVIVMILCVIFGLIAGLGFFAPTSFSSPSANTTAVPSVSPYTLMPTSAPTMTGWVGPTPGPVTSTQPTPILSTIVDQVTTAFTQALSSPSAASAAPPTPTQTLFGQLTSLARATRTGRPLPPGF